MHRRTHRTPSHAKKHRRLPPSSFGGPVVAALLVSLLGLSPLPEAHGEVPTGTPAPRGITLYFDESELDGPPARTRMLVTTEFLRIDYGNDDDDFILYDRKRPAIYSVNHADKTALVITPLKVTAKPPRPFVHRAEKDREPFPAVDGKRVVHYELFTNERRCYDLFAADGLLPDAVAALREYAQTMAGEQGATLAFTPVEMQDTCDIANHVFAPTRHLAHGFPVRLEDFAGKTRLLVNYEQGKAFPASLFAVPENYRRYRMQDMRGD